MSPVIPSNPTGGKLRAVYAAALATDQSTTSSTFVDLLAIELIPVPNDDLHIMAVLNFVLTNAASGATVSARLSSDTDGDYAGGSVTLADNQKGSIALMYPKTGAADDDQNISIQWKTTAGTVSIHAASLPGEESAALFINEINPAG